MPAERTGEKANVDDNDTNDDDDDDDGDENDDLHEVEETGRWMVGEIDLSGRVLELSMVLCRPIGSARERGGWMEGQIGNGSRRILRISRRETRRPICMGQRAVISSTALRRCGSRKREALGFMLSFCYIVINSINRTRTAAGSEGN